MPTHQSCQRAPPSTPKLVAATRTAFESCSGHPDGEEVGLASNGGCKAAPHAHRAGRRQEVKLPGHGLQQRSRPDREGRALGRRAVRGRWGGGPGTTKGQGQHRREPWRGAGTAGRVDWQVSRGPGCVQAPMQGCRARRRGAFLDRRTLDEQGVQVVRIGCGVCAWTRREHGLAPCPVSASRPAQSQGSLPEVPKTHGPASFYFLSLTSYTPQNTDINLLRIAAQMLAMWTKGPWEREGRRGRGQERGSRRQPLWHSVD